MSNRPNKFSQLENISKTPELIIPEGNFDVSVLDGLGSRLESVTPEQKRILIKKKSKETLAFLLLRKGPIRETVITGKIFQGDYLMHPKN